MTRVMIRAVDQIVHRDSLTFCPSPLPPSRVYPSPLFSVSFSIRVRLWLTAATRESVNVRVYLVAPFPPPLFVFYVCVCIVYVCIYIYILIYLSRAGSRPFIVRSRVFSLDPSRSSTLTLPISPSLSLSPFLSFDYQLEWWRNAPTPLLALTP